MISVAQDHPSLSHAQILSAYKITRVVHPLRSPGRSLFIYFIVHNFHPADTQRGFALTECVCV